MSDKCEDCMLGYIEGLGNYIIRFESTFNPNIDKKVPLDEHFKFCPECGNKINWDNLSKSDKIP